MKDETYEQLFATVLEGEGKMLRGYSNFHRYSFGNQILAMYQMIERGLDISPIGTFKKWKSLGRSVKKGQKAIQLCMPVTHTEKDEKGEVIRKWVTFIYPNRWFAMSQTDGKEVEFPPVEFDYEKALRVLGIKKVKFELVNGNVQGFARKGEIAISDLAELPLKTLFHEVAHNLLHLDKDLEFIDGENTPHNLVEVEAEAVALCVSLALGLSENVPYCVGYIKNWLGKGSDYQIPARSIKRIFSATDKILKAGQEKEKEDEGE